MHVADVPEYVPRATDLAPPMRRTHGLPGSLPVTTTRR